MHEVDGHPRAGQGRDDAAEREREVGDREARPDVPHDGADGELDEHDECRRQRRSAQARAVRLRGRAGRLARGRVGERDDEAEEGLGEAGMGDGDRRREQVDHGEAPERALDRHGGEAAPGQPAHAPAGLGARGPHREDEGEETDEAGHHPVAVLVEDTAHHRRHEHAVGQGPVGHRQARARAGHEAADEDQEEGGDGGGGAEEVAAAREGGGAPERRNGRTIPGTPGQPQPLYAKSALAFSPSLTVTFWVCDFSFSCQASISYSPAGRPLISYVPSSLLTAKNGWPTTAM